MMLKLLLSGVAVYLFAGVMPASAMSCSTAASGKGTSASRFSGLSLDARVRSVTSAAAFAELLENIGEIGPENHSYVLSLAELFNQQLGQEGLQRIARNLLMSHRHAAEAAIFSAVLMHSRGEASDARSLEGYLPKPLVEQNFLSWNELGQSLNDNPEFLAMLGTAVQDFKDRESGYGEMIDAQDALKGVLESFKNLKSPSLIGQFIDVFARADRLTRQYIFDEITELKTTQTGGVTVVLKRTSIIEKNAPAKAIEELLSKPLTQLQENAYFASTYGGYAKRPTLPDIETTKIVGLRFLRRMNYQLIEHNIQYVIQLLATYPVADPEIDFAMMSSLETGASIRAESLKYRIYEYATLELLMLERNARGLSSFNIDLRYSNLLLSEKTDLLQYLRNLQALLRKFDARFFPELRKIAASYFKRFGQD